MRMEYRQSPLSEMIEPNETVLWHSKPYKPCFILESIFNPMLPFALVWAIIDGLIIFSMFQVPGGPPSQMVSFVIPFFALHLMPVWLYLGGIILSVCKYNNTEFFVTDKAVYVSNGMIGITCKRKEYKDITEITISRGFIDQRLGVGDVIIKDKETLQNAGYYSRNQMNKYAPDMSIIDVYDYRQVYNLIQEQKRQNLNNI